MNTQTLIENYGYENVPENNVSDYERYCRQVPYRRPIDVGADHRLVGLDEPTISGEHEVRFERDEWFPMAGTRDDHRTVRQLLADGIAYTAVRAKIKAPAEPAVDWTKPIERIDGCPARVLGELLGGRLAIAVNESGVEYCYPFTKETGVLRNIPEKPRRWWIRECKHCTGHRDTFTAGVGPICGACTVTEVEAVKK